MRSAVELALVGVRDAVAAAHGVTNLGAGALGCALAIALLQHRPYSAGVHQTEGSHIGGLFVRSNSRSGLDQAVRGSVMENSHLLHVPSARCAVELACIDVRDAVAATHGAVMLGAGARAWAPAIAHLQHNTHGTGGGDLRRRPSCGQHCQQRAASGGFQFARERKSHLEEAFVQDTRSAGEVAIVGIRDAIVAANGLVDHRAGARKEGVPLQPKCTCTPHSSQIGFTSDALQQRWPRAHIRRTRKV